MIARVEEANCLGCAICVNVCPADAITMNDTARIDTKKCTGCGLCVDECPQGAISLL